MVKFKGWSALVIALLVANTQTLFLLKTVDTTSSTNFNSQLIVTRGTVEQTECEAKILRNKRTHKFIRRSRLFRDFAKSSFYDNHQFLVYVLYADDVPFFKV